MVTQNPSNVEISEGIFIHNHDNGTVNIHKHDNGTANRKEQNGMTGASYESVIRYFLTSIYAKVSRYCIDGFRMEPPMILSSMLPCVTQIPGRLLLVKS